MARTIALAVSPLVALLLVSACGGDSHSPSHSPFFPEQESSASSPSGVGSSSGTTKEVCGFEFQEDHGPSAQAALSKVDNNAWIEKGNTFTVVHDGSDEKYVKVGFRLDSPRGLYGEIRFVFTGMFPRQLEKLTAPTQKYATVRVSAPVVGGTYDGFRALEFQAEGKPGPFSCQTYLFRFHKETDGRETLELTRGITHYRIGTDVKRPALSGLIDDAPSIYRYELTSEAL